MTQQQQNRIAVAFAAYSQASANKEQAEQASAAAGSAADAAKHFATVGVKAEIAKLQGAADAADLTAYNAFQAAFQRACDATAAWGAALKELQSATSDSMNTPGSVENMAGTYHLS